MRETFAALEPYMAPQVYVNYLGDDESAGPATRTGPTTSASSTLKRRYDPDNLFHLNQNIDPAG